MQSFTILPLLGLKPNVPQNDPKLFQMLPENLAVVHAVVEKILISGVPETHVINHSDGCNGQQMGCRW